MNKSRTEMVSMERSLVLFQEALSAAEFRINWEISDMQFVHAFWNALLGAHQSASLSPIERSRQQPRKSISTCMSHN